MPITQYIQQLASSPALLITTLLTLGVIFVNGWTDAPNAIATCVSTRSMRPRAAILMAALFDFLGVFVMTMINNKVAVTVFNMVDFTVTGTENAVGDATIALCAAMFAIVTWAVLAWAFGIPTSESHALIAGISGAAIALHSSFEGINGSEWIKVIYGLVLSTILGFAMGFVIVKIVELLFRKVRLAKTTKIFKVGQIGGAAAMAFMHGAQDGQKFMGVFLLGVMLSGGKMGGASENFVIPIWLMLLCSAVMAFGTSVGGYKIIKSVGMDMVKLRTYQGFSADIAAAGCLLISSLTGIPVSTTHTKTTAIMGVGAAKRLSAVNWSIVKEMVMTWVLTFPGCGLISFCMVKLFLLIF